MTFIFDNGIQPGGGGSSVTVDQTYDATSENPQSGTAVAEAIATVDTTEIEADVTDINNAIFPTINSFNGTLEGACGDTDGILSNFSTTSYGISPSITIPSGSAWEFVTEFTTGNSNADRMGPINIISNIGDGLGFTFEISPPNKSGKMVLWLSTDGSSWDIFANAGDITLSTYTTYRVRVSYSSGTYTYDIWNGTSWGMKTSISGKSAISYETVNVRLGSNDYFGFNGTVNSNETYFKVGNTVVWKGSNITGYNKNNTNFYTKAEIDAMLAQL